MRSSKDFNSHFKLLEDLYKQRQRSFLASFERILSVSGSDSFIHQMFADKLSANYVPDRLCELVTQIIRDDREQFIMQLMEKISAFEAFYGVEFSKSIIDVGTQIVRANSPHSSPTSSRTKSYTDNKDILKRQIAAQFIQKDVCEPLLNTAQTLKETLQRTKQMFLSYQNQYKRSLESAKHELALKYHNNISNVRRSMKTKLNESQQIINEKNLQILQLQGQISNLQKKYKEASAQSEQFRSYEEQANSIRVTMEKLHSENKEKKHQTVKLQSENENLRSVNVELQKQLRSMQANIQETSLHSTQLEIKLERSIKKASKYQELLEQYRNQLDEQEERIQSLTKVYKSTESQITTLRQVKELQKDKDTQYQQRIDMLINENQDLQDEIGKLKEDNAIGQLLRAQLTQVEGDSDSSKLQGLLFCQSQVEEVQKLLEVQTFQQLTQKIKALLCINQCVQEILITSSSKKGPNDVKSLNRLFSSLMKSKAILKKIQVELSVITENDETDVHKLVEALKEQIAEYKANESRSQSLVIEKRQMNQQISSFMNELESHVGNISQIAETVDLVKTKSQSTIDVLNKRLEGVQAKKKQYKEQLIELQEQVDMVVREAGVVSLSVVPYLLNDHKKNSELLDHITQILGNPDDIEVEIASIVSVMSEISDLLNSQRISSFPKEIAELMNQKSKLSEIKNSLSLKSESKVTKVIDSLKETKSNQETILEKIGIIIDANDISQFPKVIKSIVKGFHYYDAEISTLMKTTNSKTPQKLFKRLHKVANLQQTLNLTKVNDVYSVCQKNETMNEVSSLLSLNNSKDAVEEIKSLKSSTQVLNKLCSLAQVEDSAALPSFISQHIFFEKQITKIMNINDLDSIPSEIAVIKKSHQELQFLLAQLHKENASQVISSYTQLSSNFDIMSKALKIDDFSDIAAHVSLTERICRQLSQTMDTSDLGSAINKITRNEKIISQLLQVIDVQDANALATQVNSLKAQAETNKQREKTEKNLCSILKVDKNRLVNQITSYNEIITKLMSILRVSTPSLIVPHVNRTIDTSKSHDVLQSLCSLLATTEDSIVDLISHYSQACLLLKCSPSEVDHEIQQLQSNFNTANQFLTLLQSTLSGSPRRISFPLARPVSQKLIDLIREIKYRADEAQQVLSRAAASGFQGSSCNDALDFLIHAAADSERQKAIFQKHKELADLRLTAEKERKITEKQLEKSQSKIRDLKETISELQSESMIKEQELKKMSSKLKGSKSKSISTRTGLSIQSLMSSSSDDD